MTTSIELDQGSYRLPSVEHATVADAMRVGVMSCEPDVPATLVARMMAGRHIHCLVVEGIHAEPGHGERLVWGVISDMDLLRAIHRDGLEPTAGELAASEPIAVEPSTSLREAIALMAERGTAHLIVTDGRRPIGVLSTLDVAGVFAWGRA